MVQKKIITGRPRSWLSCTLSPDRASIRAKSGASDPTSGATLIGLVGIGVSDGTLVGEGGGVDDGGNGVAVSTGGRSVAVFMIAVGSNREDVAVAVGRTAAVRVQANVSNATRTMSRNLVTRICHPFSRYAVSNIERPSWSHSEGSV